MKRYYLHISYTGKAKNGVIFGDTLVMTFNESLAKIRERIKDDSGLVELPSIISISELSKGLYDYLLSRNTDKK